MNPISWVSPKKRVVFALNLSPSGSWRDRACPLSVKRFDAWDTEWRKRLGWFTGLKFWQKTNVRGSRTLLSRQWPHKLCWDWCVWVNRPTLRNPFAQFRLSRCYRHAEVGLFWASLYLTWQDYGHMVNLRHPAAADAPKVRWKHELAAMPYAGSA